MFGDQELPTPATTVSAVSTRWSSEVPAIMTAISPMPKLVARPPPPMMS